MLSRRAFSVTLLGLGLLFASTAHAESRLKFVLYKDAADEFRFRLKAGNGEILATSGEGYKAKADAKKTIKKIIADIGKYAFEVYEDKKGEHRFRLKAKNGQIVAVSSEGYKQKSDAEKAIATIEKGAADAEVSDET
jgi:uncharacterized protein YegP (UPF0339 family)